MTAEVASKPVITIAPTQPVAPTTQTRTKITICSVYPVRKEAERRHATLRPLNNGTGKYGLTCTTVYALEAAPRESYATLTVFDALTPITGWSEMGSKENTLTPGHIPVQVVADDLANTWSAQTIASKDGYKPGIGQIAGDVPTEAELAHLRAQQAAFFRFMVDDGNDKLLRGETKNITNIHRNAAHWLLGEGARQLAWYPQNEQREVKDCPRCSRQILATALGCEHCSLDLVGWYDRYTHLTPDVFVAQFMANIPKVPPAVKPPVHQVTK